MQKFLGNRIPFFNISLKTAIVMIITLLVGMFAYQYILTPLILQLEGVVSAKTVTILRILVLTAIFILTWLAGM